ncbi:hypothetical protein, partial [Rhodanobacter sp. Root179]|uniref:hypothetical protein n=1 Tax=Rhodanobacter sp. Root179 TaxID=1736482 RepID=UPI001F30F505
TRPRLPQPFNWRTIMATESIASTKPYIGTTGTISFRSAGPDPDIYLFDTIAGVSRDLALSEAVSLESAVRLLLSNAVDVNGMDGQIAWLCGFALEAADALRTAACPAIRDVR